MLPVRIGSAPVDDPVFFARFAAYFDARIGCPSIPVEMFLKFRHRLGHELLCREVADSLSWQRFCPIQFRTDHGDEDHHPVRRRCGRGVE